ncbi:subtilisin family serine protease [Actinoalloteichus hoggarensis]|uniref:Subtilisin BL n=1 Tax=Actinoalloteichus hoggarensis TaxID=1470176 RepID=A0A221W7E7_9PSEU|nr:S8 family serine peptidase [Actinoalloteichus hoggarensis]ASO21287.1 Subtilisin BL [Actinoalloteichus hoggarensis]MBB5921219.1 subtilisin family serine protease [Actinoalloteichus hoggarensis]
MRSPALWRLAAVIGALSLAAPAAAAGAAPPGLPPLGTSDHAESAPVRSVTLITGDRVVFSESEDELTVLAVEQPEGRRGIGWLHTFHGDTVSVLPYDAMELVSTGRLDPRLFDITGLVAQGLADDETDTLGLIMADHGEARTLSAVPSTAEVTAAMPDLGMQAVSVDRSDTQEFWTDLVAAPAVFAADSVDTVWLDGRVRASLDVSAELVGAPEAWETGFTGEGVRVAVLDTGYDTEHPDLTDAVVEARSFVDGVSSAHDGRGHGTHVAGTIAGSGAASEGRYRGVAPDADLLIGKVLGDDGWGDESWIIAGMEWAARQGADVVNLSLGQAAVPTGDPMIDAAERLSEEHGTLIVAAAGNDGQRGTVSSPAVADSVLAVASTTKDDELSDFSSQGPRPWDFGLKPEIAAPGSDITAAGAGVTGARYQTYSGTSMAAPHVAGAAALLAQARPTATGAELKSVLVGAAAPLPGVDVHGQGAGRLDVLRAVEAEVFAETAVLAFGLQSWPHEDAEDAVGSIEYRNPTDEDVRLTLSVDGDAPDGLVALEATTVLVPAGGSAAVAVRAARGAEVVGEYTGHITARSGDQRITTPWSIHVEKEAFDVPLEFTDSEGEAVVGAVLLADLDTGEVTMNDYLADHIRLYAGDYRLVGFVLGEYGEPDQQQTAFAADRFTVEEGAALRFSGRDGEPVEIGIEDAAHDIAQARGGLILSADRPGGRMGLHMWSTPDTRVIPSGPLQAVDFHYYGYWERPSARGRVLGADGFALGPLSETSASGFDRTVRGTLSDITTMPPAELPDLTGRIAFIADLEWQSDPDHHDALAQAAVERGAEAVLSYNFLYQEAAVPLVELGLPSDARLLLERTASGPTDVELTLAATTPEAYFLADTVAGGLEPDLIDWRFERAELAQVEAGYHNPIGVPGQSQAMVFYDTGDRTTGLLAYGYRLPTERTEYYSPGVSWERSLDLGYDTESFVRYPTLQTLPETLAGGPQPRHDLWAGPIGPTVTDGVVTAEGVLPSVFRRDDELVVAVSMFGDDDPRNLAVDHEIDSGTTVLRRDGAEIGRGESPGTGAFALPASDGFYELSATGVRTADWWRMSTEVRADWRFRSTGGEPGDVVVPRLLDVRYDLDLDELNTAAADVPVTGTATVAAPPGATTAPVTEFALSYSLDDGATWHDAAISPNGDSWTVEIPAAGQDEHVSLRASASDEDGHSVTETITRAYLVR